MNNMAVLDTNFLISLVDRNRPHHAAAKSYYKVNQDGQKGLDLPHGEE